MSERKVTIRQLDKSKTRSRCRKWMISIKTDKREKSGNFKWIRKTFSGMYTEAKAEAERLSKEPAEEKAQSSETYDIYSTRLIESRYAAGLIEVATYNKYKYMNSLMVDAIGKMPIGDITADTIMDAYISIRKSKPNLSNTTLSDMHTVCSGIFERARKSGKVSSNPFADCDRPKKSTVERNALTIAETVMLIDALDASEPHELAVILILEAGLRRGEVCALRWMDVSEKSITVAHSMREDGSVKSTKSGKPREVPISARLRMALSIASEKVHSPDDFVITSESGSVMIPHNLTRWWRRNRDSYGLSDFTLHDFRHTFCTNLAESGIHPRVMMRLMGHSTESVTMRIYSHVHEFQLSEAIEQMDAAKSPTQIQRNFNAKCNFSLKESKPRPAHFPSRDLQECYGGRNRVRTCGPFRVKGESGDDYE